MNQLDSSDSDELLKEYLDKAHVRLFVSIDLAGSTALKHLTDIDEEMPWIITFENFYEEFPKQLLSSYDDFPSYPDKEKFLTPERLSVFKILGDEILFYVEISRHEQTLYHIHAVKEATKEFNERLQTKYRFLQCKPTAWLAGFPVVNSEIHISDSGRELPLDYIGPSMDTGFRLTKLATPRKFVLSFDLALMLTDALIAARDPDRKPRFFYDGSQPLAGVLGGVPYPVIWIDLYDSTPREERLQGIDRQPCITRELNAFCYDFRERNKIWRWFIKGDDHQDYRGPDHPQYEGPNEEWLERYRSIKAKREANKQSGGL